jgi:AraC-like DNA-binding protein
LRHLLLAAVAAPRLARLRSLDPARYDWIDAGSWAQALHLIRTRPFEMAVADPLLGSEPRPHSIERLRLLFPSLPLLVYTELSPDTARVLLKLGRAGIQRAVFQRFEDGPRALRAVVETELEHSVSRQVMTGIRERLKVLPEPIREALETMLYDLRAGLTVSELAGRALLSRRTCERFFTKVGLPSPKWVMLLIRLLYAHRLLLDPGHTVEDVAVKLGYGKARTLQRQLRAVFGLSAGELRASVTVEEGMTIVSRRFFERRRAAVLNVR